MKLYTLSYLADTMFIPIPLFFNKPPNLVFLLPFDENLQIPLPYPHFPFEKPHPQQLSIIFYGKNCQSFISSSQYIISKKRISCFSTDTCIRIILTWKIYNVKLSSSLLKKQFKKTCEKLWLPWMFQTIRSFNPLNASVAIIQKPVN